MADNPLDLNRFIPKFLLNLFQRNSFYNNAYLLGQTGPIWISVVEPYELYVSIPELRAVIDMDASMFSNMRIYKRNKLTGMVIEDNELETLLAHPNCTQSQNTFLKQYRQQLVTYGNQFIYRNSVNSKAYPISLWNISPYYLQPVLSGKMFDQTEMNGIITKYKMINTLSLGAVEYTRGFEPEEILFTRVNDLNNPIIGKSPLSALKYPLSNIEQGYKALNVAMQRTGLGLISPEGKDMGAAAMLTPKERKGMEEQLSADYGINEGQRRTMLANGAVKFQSMAVGTRDMMIIEGNNYNVRTICNMLNMNSNIFLSNTTYENLRSGIVQCYQDNIIPSSDEFVKSLGKFLNIKENEELVASYDHLSILKENKLTGMQSIESIVKSLTQAVAGGILDAKSATSILATELNLNAASY